MANFFGGGTADASTARNQSDQLIGVRCRCFPSAFASLRSLPFEILSLAHFLPLLLGGNVLSGVSLPVVIKAISNRVWPGHCVCEVGGGYGHPIADSLRQFNFTLRGQECEGHVQDFWPMGYQLSRQRAQSTMIVLWLQFQELLVGPGGIHGPGWCP